MNDPSDEVYYDQVGGGGTLKNTNANPLVPKLRPMSGNREGLFKIHSKQYIPWGK